MKIKIPEKPISNYKDGKKFTTYTDEKIIDYPAPCPCCSKEMNFSQHLLDTDSHSWGPYIQYIVGCSECKLIFEGSNENSEFLDGDDFIKFVLSRLGLKK